MRGHSGAASIRGEGGRLRGRRPGIRRRGHTVAAAHQRIRIAQRSMEPIPGRADLPDAARSTITAGRPVLPSRPRRTSRPRDCRIGSVIPHAARRARPPGCSGRPRHTGPPLRPRSAGRAGYRHRRPVGQARDGLRGIRRSRRLPDLFTGSPTRAAPRRHRPGRRRRAPFGGGQVAITRATSLACNCASAAATRGHARIRSANGRPTAASVQRGRKRRKPTTVPGNRPGRESRPRPGRRRRPRAARQARRPRRRGTAGPPTHPAVQAAQTGGGTMQGPDVCPPHTPPGPAPACCPAPRPSTARRSSAARRRRRPTSHTSA
ncbi:hypothetical protein DC74_148 [Streptomyces noursei]|nr:hypothetical protein DC74_148 [Streptomyces noursei]